MFDTHCHLQTSQFDPDREQVISSAGEKGVEMFMVPAIDKESFGATLSLAASHGNIYCGLGIHPHSAAEWSEEIGQFIVTETARNPKVVAIGEIGLDYYYDFCPKDVQIRAFREQIVIAQKLRKPIVIHTRDSIDETLDIVEECYKEQPQTYTFGHFHCFSGTVSQMYRAVEAGFFVSFTGNITFKNSTLRDVVREVPLDRVMIETDSPYLAPVPHRGKRNSPEYLGLVAERIAEIKQLTPNEIMAATTTNAKRLFLSALGILLFFVLTLSPGSSEAQVGSRPPDSVMTKERRDAEELIRKQKEQMMKAEEERRQDSIKNAQLEMEQLKKDQMDQARKDSVKAAERIADEEKARIKAQTPIPWKAISLGGSVGIGNLELSQTKSTLTPTAVFASSISLGTQISRVIDFEISLNQFKVNDDLTGDHLYNFGDSTPSAFLDTAKLPSQPYRVPIYETITTKYWAFDVRFVFTPKSPLKFYAGLGYTATTITNNQQYNNYTAEHTTDGVSHTLESSITRGGIQGLIGARYDFEIDNHFIVTPFIQIGSAFLFSGDNQLASFVFQTDKDQIVFTHTKVGVVVNFGWFTVDRYK
jgi:TatD DNase family protein